ncbi:MAG: cell wall hydrolase [Lachnospiraceae bacterium]|nr:cell wall hydrolase [Lachnospiraceae bacterium]
MKFAPVSKRIRRTVALLCAGIFFVGTLIKTPYISAFATSSSAIGNKVNELQGELDSLNSELSDLSASIDEASANIEKVSAEAEEIKLEVAVLNLGIKSQYDTMKSRIIYVYEGGSYELLEILFTADSMADFLNKAEYVSTIANYDKDMLNELSRQIENAKAKEALLAAKQAELEDLKKDLAEKEAALNSKISSTTASIADYKKQFERAKAAEAALAAAQNNNVVGPSSPANSSGNSGSTTNTNTGNSSTTQPETPVTEGAYAYVGAMSPTPEDLVLMAAILQLEAGSSYEGMIAVGTVITNRMSRSNTDLRSVVYAKSQFSPAGNGTLNKLIANSGNIRSSSWQAANDIFAGKRHALVLGPPALHNFWAASYAASHGRGGITIGGNLFFNY